MNDGMKSNSSYEKRSYVASGIKSPTPGHEKFSEYPPLQSLIQQTYTHAHRISSSSSSWGGGAGAGAAVFALVLPATAPVSTSPISSSKLSTSSTSSSSSSSPPSSPPRPANMFTPALEAAAAPLTASQAFLRLAISPADLLLFWILRAVRSTISSARSRPLSRRFRALVLRTDLRPFLAFLETPALWWMPRIEGRLLTSLGGWTSLRDLSVLMLGEVARRAAREWTEGPVGGWERRTSILVHVVSFLSLEGSRLDSWLIWDVLLTFGPLFYHWFSHCFAGLVWFDRGCVIVWSKV